MVCSMKKWAICPKPDANEDAIISMMISSWKSPELRPIVDWEPDFL
jgi:hypothetical protein